jgi:hypothetical protein
MSIHKWEQYELGEHYDSIIANLKKFPALNDYINNQDFFKKDDNEKTITYKTELLCPSALKGRIPILMLFSNPHPKSIIAGMFLSPEKTVNRFWISMQGAEMFKLDNIPEISKEHFPEPIRSRFMNLEYDSPFAFYFNTLFSFPSSTPEDLIQIFGSFFKDHILPESRNDLMKFLKCKKIHHIICFGKQAFQYISNYTEGDLIGYTKKVAKCGFINSKFMCNKTINLYLTCPTGQGGCKAEDRINSLRSIKDKILDERSL